MVGFRDLVGTGIAPVKKKLLLRRYVHGHVLVVFLESVVLFDVVQVISSDNHLISNT